MSNHHCHWPGCVMEVPPKLWGCRAHWFSLPKNLRVKIWDTYRKGQEIDKRPSPEYIEVANEVQMWIAAKLTADRERFHAIPRPL